MGLSVVKLFENKTKKKKRMVNYAVISLLQISSRNRFQEFESHKRINLIPFLTSSSYFLLQNSLYCAYNADFFPLRTRRFISLNSSHSQLALKCANKTPHQIIDVSVNYWLQLLMHIHQELSQLQTIAKEILFIQWNSADVSRLDICGA